MVLDEIQTAISRHDYTRAVERASAALDQDQDRSAIILLYYRAYALSMQGKYDDAETDARVMISSKPASPLGYQRLGHIYQIQDRWQLAIDVYKLGLQMVSADHQGYGSILKSKEAAEKRNKNAVDFIAKLPIEIVDEIIRFLPQNYKLVCLQVSETWRVKLLACRKAWRIVTTDGMMDKGHIMSIIDHLAAYIEEFTINTNDKQVLNTCLRSMRYGSFISIGKLCLTPTTMEQIDTSMMMTVATAFYQTRTTLTRLVLHHDTGHIPLVLADLLAMFTNLRSLVYSTTNRLKNIVGELPLPNPHHALIDLELSVVHTAHDATIRPFLCNCPELRRLVINFRFNKHHFYRRIHGEYIFDIVDRACKKLKIFTYNIPDWWVPPTLDESGISQDGHSGIQEVYMRMYTPLTPILELLRRNAATLKTVSLLVSARPSELVLIPIYGNIEFARLEKLTLSHCNSDIAPLFYQWISRCDTLLHLDVSSLYDVADLVNALISRSRLTALSFSSIKGPSTSTHLTRLFHSYTADFRSSRALGSITLIAFTVNDSVLDALSGIQTLQSITLTYLDGVSTNGLTRLFASLGESTTTIRLTHMNFVTDQHLTIIGRLKYLETIHLESLELVTGDGVWNMVSRAPSLRFLTIARCKGVSEKAILHAKEKVRSTTRLIK